MLRVYNVIPCMSVLMETLVASCHLDNGDVVPFQMLSVVVTMYTAVQVAIPVKLDQANA